MNASDCLVFTSRSEGSPNAVKEAMACSLPIVSTAVGDVAERLAGVEGCFVSSPTADAFADAVLATLRSGRSDAARRAVAGLSVGAVAERLLSIYHEADQRHGLRAPRRPA